MKNNQSRFLTIFALLLPSFGLAFQSLSKVETRQTIVCGLKNNEQDSQYVMEEGSRRDFFRTVTSSLTIGSMVTLLGPQSSMAAEGTTQKILVLGGTGFVGSRVVQKLQDLGVEVIATSRDGRDGTVAFDVSKIDDVASQMERLSKGCTAVISTIGAIGTPDDASINSATGFAAVGAKAAGVERFVYFSVAPEVKEFAKNIDFLKPYMQGKTFSQDTVVSNFPGSGSFTLIEPTFIHGGDEFNVNPPRVAGFYGEFIESLLGSAPIRAVTNICPEGIVKIALEPPVSVESVAGAAVAGALGKAQLQVLDTHDKIKEAGSLV
jgi:hypothetical protein